MGGSSTPSSNRILRYVISLCIPLHTRREGKTERTDDDDEGQNWHDNSRLYGRCRCICQGWSFTKSGHDQPSRNGRDRLIANNLPNLVTRLGLVTGS